MTQFRTLDGGYSVDQTSETFTFVKTTLLPLSDCLPVEEE